jgi:hypothetical protein
MSGGLHNADGQCWRQQTKKRNTRCINHDEIISNRRTSELSSSLDNFKRLALIMARDDFLDQIVTSSRIA